MATERFAGKVGLPVGGVCAVSGYLDMRPFRGPIAWNAR
jgi:hypothetical protein